MSVDNLDSGFSSSFEKIFASSAPEKAKAIEDEETSSGSSTTSPHEKSAFLTSSADSLSSDNGSKITRNDNLLAPAQAQKPERRYSPNLRRKWGKGATSSAPLAPPEDDHISHSLEMVDFYGKSPLFNPPPPSPSAGSGKKLSTGRMLMSKCRFKLPPPLRLAKKKHSCPSLTTTYNNALSSSPTPVPIGSNFWIKNPISANEDPGPSRFFFGDSNPEESSSSQSSPQCAAKSQSCPSFRNSPPGGARYKLIHEGHIQVCRFDHPRTVIGKLSSSKLLRRWESHLLVFSKEDLSSPTPAGFMEKPISFTDIEDLHILPHFDSNDKYCLRIFVPEGSVLLQTNHSYSRNQWLHSIQWRRNMSRFKRLLESTDRPEVLLKEIKNMVDDARDSPLQDENVYLRPVQLVCEVIRQIYENKLPRTLLDPIINCVAPLLESVAAVAEICPWLNKYCQDSPRSRLIDDVFANVAHQCLKKNMDFGKYPSARTFIQNFMLAVNTKNNGLQRIQAFIQSVHGPASVCPHPRILPNLVSTCLAAVHAIFDPNDVTHLEPVPEPPIFHPDTLDCFCMAFLTIVEYEDWRGALASVLQPLPFPDSAFAHDTFAKYFKRIVLEIVNDPRCDVHLTVLGVRDGKEGWFHLFCPGGLCCLDDGELYAELLKRLLHCCCRRKKFLQSLVGMAGPLQLLALRENEAAMEALCGMLEMEVLEEEDLKLQLITALQSTFAGKRLYAQLCDRQIALRELQQKGGPRKLTMPSKSTDGDLAVLLSSGSFGNLEWLSLAFTNVTSACAEYLVKLPSLRYLNLWSTQFGDLGVQMISEHLHKLQVLNLCETPVTDKGLTNLTGLKNIRKLNLNSTQLSAKTFQIIREKLPALQEVDIRYTEAWCAADYSS